MTPQEELDAIYISIGEGKEIDDAMQTRINELDAIVNPVRQEYVPSVREVGCGCGSPRHCWECAAIRGGCPEDV